MAEYIERKAALHAIDEFFHDPKVDIALNAVPDADVAPVRHGMWIEKDKYAFGTFYDCSICGNLILDNGHSWNYCPNCGAKMEGGSD